jgi:DNA polymerase-3 subunit chi
MLQDRRLFEIIEHAYERHEKVVIYAGTVERAADIDRLLWINKQESFIPHRIFSGPAQEFLEPIAIVTAEKNPIGANILVADAHCSLDFALSFDVVHEFVRRSSPEMHEACRNRFRAYRARQVAVAHQR